MLTGAPGTVIRWVNTEAVEHSATAVSTFDCGLLSPGESDTFTASREGAFTYNGAIDPFNRGTVIVDPNAPPMGQQFLFLPAMPR